MIPNLFIRSVMVVASLSVLALSGCGKDVQRSGKRDAQTQPTDALTGPDGGTQPDGGSGFVPGGSTEEEEEEENNTGSDSDDNSNPSEGPNEESNLPEAPNGKAPNGKAPNGKAPNGKAPNGKAPNGKAPNGKAPNGKAPNGKAPNGKAPNGKAPNGKAPNGKAPNGKAPNGKGSTRPAPDNSQDGGQSEQPGDGGRQTDPDVEELPRNTPSRPRTDRPRTERPRGEEPRGGGSRGATCEDNTIVPSSARRAGYETIVNGKRGTWQLVNFKVHAVGHTSTGTPGGAVKLVRSSVKGDALNSVTVWPECQDVHSIPSGNFAWKATMPMLFASKDGWVSDEIRYSERLEGERSVSDSSSSMDVKAPSACKVVIGSGAANSRCGSMDFYTLSSRKAVIVKTTETKDTSGNKLTVTVLGNYAWVEGEEVMSSSTVVRGAGEPDDSATSVSTAISERTRRTTHTPGRGTRVVSEDDGDVTDLGNMTMGGSRPNSSSNSNPNPNSNSGNSNDDPWENDSWEDVDTDFGDVMENDRASNRSSKVDVVYVGQRPCCCRVLTKKQARKVRRAIRRATRGTAKACSSRVIRACS